MITYTYGNPDAKTVLIQMVDDHDLEGMESEVAVIRKMTNVDFSLLAVKVQNWNADLSPWTASAVFGKDGFGNGAVDTLVDVLKYCSDEEKTYIIGGYSLAGLFALWAAYQTDVFKAVAAASPSVWFPGFLDFMSYMAAAVSSRLFASAAHTIGWSGLILVWLALMLAGVFAAFAGGGRRA